MAGGGGEGEEAQSRAPTGAPSPIAARGGCGKTSSVYLGGELAQGLGARVWPGLRGGWGGLRCHEPTWSTGSLREASTKHW